MLYRIAVLAGVLVLTGSLAQAASETYTATLAQPAASANFATDHLIWRCDGTTCVTKTNPSFAKSVGACRELESHVGKVVAYGSQDHTLNAEDLARCNDH